MEQRTVKAGDSVYLIGDQDQNLYLIRRGAVRIMAPISGSRQLHHIATFGRGDFFGGLAFLDDRARSDSAIAYTDTDLFVLSLDQFNQLTNDHKKLAFLLITSISRTLIACATRMENVPCCMCNQESRDVILHQSCKITLKGITYRLPSAAD